METSLPTLSARVYASLPEGITNQSQDAFCFSKKYGDFHDFHLAKSKWQHSRVGIIVDAMKPQDQNSEDEDTKHLYTCDKLCMGNTPMIKI